MYNFDSDAKFQMWEGDCLGLMKLIPDGSVDTIICDLPYGNVTSAKWDKIIPLKPMWEQYERVIKPKGAICLFAKQPFSSALLVSNPKRYRYSWYMEKSNGANFARTGFQPLMVIEEILIFSKAAATFTNNFSSMYYQPPLQQRDKPYTMKYKKNRGTDSAPLRNHKITEITTTTVTPRNLLTVTPDGEPKLHPTQKPLGIVEYLVLTYTDKNGTVLDNCFGSNTTGVACHNTGRRYIGIERDPEYFEIGVKRLADQQALPVQPNFLEMPEAQAVAVTPTVVQEDLFNLI